MKAKSQDLEPYITNTVAQEEDEVINQALDILFGRLKVSGVKLGSPGAVRSHLALKMATLEHEEFHVMLLDAQNRLIDHEALFRGTVTQTSVYPREVIKLALSCNAVSVVFAHNHPSGTPDPSSADHNLTQALKKALEFVDVRVLDHIIVAGRETYSFAEHGCL